MAAAGRLCQAAEGGRCCCAAAAEAHACCHTGSATYKSSVVRLAYARIYVITDHESCVATAHLQVGISPDACITARTSLRLLLLYYDEAPES